MRQSIVRKLRLGLFFVALILLVGMLVRAETPTPAVPIATPASVATVSPAPAAAAVPVIGAGVLAWLQNLIGFQPPAWLATLIVFFLTEVVGRIWKTQAPFSLFYFLRDGSVLLSKLFNAVGTFLDGILQNVAQKQNPPQS